MKSRVWSIIFVISIVIGIIFLTKLWLPSGVYLVGHDSGLAINSRDFLMTRIYAWSVQGFGQDNSPHFGSLIIHTVDFLTSLMSGVPYAGNYINISFWLSLIFISAFFFANSLKENLGKYFPFLFSIFITINFFVIQSLFILERAKYSIFVADLLILTFLFKLENKVYGFKKTLYYILITLFFLNSGSWLGVPLYGSMALLFMVFVLMKLITFLISKNYREMFKFLLFLAILPFGFVLINAYSIFPYIATFLESDSSSIVNPLVVGQNMAWLRSLSQFGSHLNFFRLQGIPDWYSGNNGINLQHAFANEYLTNPLLIIVSFTFPILAFCSFLFVKNDKQKYLITFFTLVTLIGMFLMAGSHKPLGFIFEIFYVKIPGFAIFRSPYYKFASAFLIGYLGLISFTLSSLLEKYGRRLKISLLLFILTCWITYHGVIFDKQKIFSWQKDLSTLVSFPSNIDGFAENINNLDIGASRILLVPPLNQNWKNDGYGWGYWSLTNLPSLIAPKQSFLVNDSSLSGLQNIWLSNVYESIRENREDDFILYIKKLNVKYLLLRNDVLQTSDWSSSDNPLDYMKNLDTFKNVSVKKVFSKWILYEINIPIQDKIIVIDKVVSVSKNNLSLVSKYVGDNSHFGQMNDGKIFTFSNCMSCDTELKIPDGSLPEVSLLPSSKFYFIKKARDQKLLKNISGKNLAFSYLGIALRKTSEAMMMSRFDTKDSFVETTLEDVNFDLTKVFEYLKNNSDPSTDHSTYSGLQDSLYPIETNLKQQISKDEFAKKSESLRQGYYNVLWTIRKINDLYSPIIAKLDNYRQEKVYSLSFDSPGIYKIHVNSKDFPQSVDGQKIKPVLLRIIQGEITVEIKSQDEKQGVFFEIVASDAGTYKGTLYFENLPNLYNDLNSDIIPLISGNNRCTTGKIYSFNQDSSYRINFSILDKLQRLRFYIKNSSTDNNNFLRGNVEKEINSIETVDKYSYLFRPYGATDPTIYLCNSNSEIPQLNNWEVFEIVSPTLIVEKIFSQPTETNNTPVNYKMINPTRYELVISNNQNHILIFNETYSPLWKLKRDGVEIKNAVHFTIDGHANAWILPNEISGNLTIEYSSQSYFYIGIITTTIFMVLLTGYFIITNVKK